METQNPSIAMRPNADRIETGRKKTHSPSTASSGNTESSLTDEQSDVVIEFPFPGASTVHRPLPGEGLNNISLLACRITGGFNRGPRRGRTILSQETIPPDVSNTTRLQALRVTAFLGAGKQVERGRLHVSLGPVAFRLGRHSWCQVTRLVS